MKRVILFVVWLGRRRFDGADVRNAWHNSRQPADCPLSWRVVLGLFRDHVLKGGRHVQ